LAVLGFLVLGSTTVSPKYVWSVTNPTMDPSRACAPDALHCPR
jgi:hypothetical protein